ncbi:YczE/YyaS/YitT family protein [Lentilactobacillus laojiaonis]|uniref:YczE/YyaS/YitT family protein n=1 Tax=Lentilactobacillus laojiaonis TaxID=2883998 RepID=UPI001D0A7621|nr:hypothetical protein [Lentilactobacillus laojiaonis]UDM32252.1 hypothetical protein LHL71_00505 [Lentilactobacillus laojiaonis]
MNQPSIHPQQNNKVLKRHHLENLLLKTLMSFIGIGIISIGSTLLLKSVLGMDPFTALNIAVSGKLGFSLGTYQLFVNIAIFVFVLIFDFHLIGIGTILNMVLIGYEIEWFTAIYGNVFPDSSSFFVKLILAVVGLLIFSFGASMYMTADVGVSPYDAIAPIISNRLNFSYKVVRVVQDSIFLVGAFFAAGPVGVVTLIVAFFTGPLIVFWTDRINKPIVRWIGRLCHEENAKD